MILEITSIIAPHCVNTRSRGHHAHIANRMLFGFISEKGSNAVVFTLSRLQGDALLN